MAAVRVVLFSACLHAADVFALDIRTARASRPDTAIVNKILDAVLMDSSLTPQQHALAEKTSRAVRSDVEAIANNFTMSAAEKRSKYIDAFREINNLKDGLMEHRVSNQGVEPPNASLQETNQHIGIADSRQIAREKKDIELKKKSLEVEEEALQKEAASTANFTHLQANSTPSDQLASLAAQERQTEVLAMKRSLEVQQKQLSREEDELALVSSTTKREKARALGRSANLTNQTEMSNDSASVVIPALKPILANLQTRHDILAKAVDKLDKAEKSRLEEISQALRKDPSNHRSQGILKGLKSKGHRKYEKARAAKITEMSELKSAIASIKRGDLKALTQIMERMKAAMSKRDPKFLY